MAACGALLALRLPAQACDPTQGSPDSLPATLRANFTAARDRDSVPRADADSLGFQLRAALHLGDQAPIVEWTPSIGETVPTMQGVYAFVVDKNGSMRDVRIVRPSLAPSIDSVLVAALEAATLPPRPDRDRWLMRVGLSTPQKVPVLVSKPVMMPGLDTTKHVRSTSGIVLAEFAQRVPVWEDNKLPRLVRMGRPPMSAASINGTVVVEVVADEKGHVIRNSIYPAFPVDDWKFDAARSVAEHYEFTPFVVHGCAVKVYMMLPIRFVGQP